MKLKKLSQALLVGCCFVAASASATVITVMAPIATSNSIDVQDTNWSDFLSFVKFDSSLGTLQSVKLDLYSDVVGGIDVTNYNASSVKISTDLSATIALQRNPSDNLVLLTAPLFSGQVEVAAGANYTDSNSYTAHADATYTDVATLALFSAPGGGTLSTVITANGGTLADMTGVDATFTTQAGGHGSITYSYIAAVPEPETYGMLLLGLGMMGVVAKRKQRAAKV
ncbi:choice-of-anchor E domain-containing protein [Duganella sp. FT80W]|uniref:Choice-of-anchor E domain-containing protein n=1 Tax=Duganella guangzhouensis TaxID=2666084 RepID=A0A6I2KUI7_9BURK|nr:choice-of-anchor E domain-containing protein [Duganella guangzhouensis]MRW89132.1 choice-of-anchor E domain-containing protein [Duganella guangzhouensis]